MDVLLIAIWLLFAVEDIFALQSCPVWSLKLKNGRVRSVGEGHLRYNCKRGYMLMGAKYVFCLRGTWDAETPVCIKPGCYWNRNDYFAGILLESYLGALIKVECHPGYTTGGPKTVYCDGQRWNGTFPQCNPLTDEPAKSCDFEDGDFCDWIQDPSNRGYNWKLAANGHYIHLDSDRAKQAPNSINITSRLYSPVYPPSFTGQVTCFSFLYYMHGRNAGSLKVYLLLQGHALEEAISDFWVQGDPGDRWNRGFFYIQPPGTHFQIVIEGTKYGEYEIALDDLNIGFDSECEKQTTTEGDLSTTTDSFDSIEDFTCRNRCGKTAVITGTDVSYEDLQELMKCDCHFNCVRLSTCCLDFIELCWHNAASWETIFSTAPTTALTVALTKKTMPTTTPTTTSSTTTSTAKPTTKETIPTTLSTTPAAKTTLASRAPNLNKFQLFVADKGRKTTDSISVHSNAKTATFSLSYVVLLCLGIALGILCITSVALVIIRRRKKAREECALAEDSDVRFLTSDEFLDFALARPSE